MTKILEWIQAVVWGVPTLMMILGVGIVLSFRTGFAQVTLFKVSICRFAEKLTAKGKPESGVTSFQALCTALAATVGTGNLVGVAGAICIGGPGAIFWMWVCGFFAMVIKMAEAALAVRYRVKENGTVRGGPMYIIRNGLPSRWHFLAGLYSFFGIVAALGVGNATQINAMITGLHDALARFGIASSRMGDVLVGLGLALCIGILLSGGAPGIGRVTQKLVPVTAAAYIVLCAGVLVLRFDMLGWAFCQIIRGAFYPGAVTGGAIGSALTVIRVGCCRGVFTNEAGMGTAGIAHGSAEAVSAVEQGMMGIVEVFLDTIVICTLTALVILCSGVPIPYGLDLGVELTGSAFCAVYGRLSGTVLSIAICCFAFATVLGWGVYGATCTQYLFGGKAWSWFVLLQCIAVVAGAVLESRTVWLLAEIINGLMALPNLITLAFLSPEVERLIIDYRKSGKMPVEVYHADFNQRKPLRTLSHAKIPPLCGGSQEEGKAHLSSEHRSARSAHPGSIL